MTSRSVWRRAGVLVVLCCLALLGAGCSGDGQPSDSQRSKAAERARNSAAPLLSALPDAPANPATKNYLQGEGKPLVTGMHRSATALLALGDSPSLAQCQQVVTDLENVLSTSQVLDQLDQVEDAAMRDALHLERTALDAALSGCLNAGSPAPTQTVGLAAAVGIVDVRLEQLGLPR